MKRFLLYGCYALVALLAVSAAAQNRREYNTQLLPPDPATTARLNVPKSSAAVADVTSVCSYNYATGAGDNYMQYCITANGNFANFQAPSGVEMLNQGAAYEGYGICDGTTGAHYYDYEYVDSGNWNAPVLVAHTTTYTKISRTTTDGAWTLTQTITVEKGPPPYAKILMQLKNNSAAAKLATLIRFANFDPDQGGASYNLQNYDSTSAAAFGYTPQDASYTTNGGPYGMSMRTILAPTPTTGGSWAAFVISSANGPDPCSIVTSTTLVNSPGSAVQWYVYYPFNPHATTSVTLGYFPF